MRRAAVVLALVACAGVAPPGRAGAADRDFGYGAGTGAYSPGSSSSYGVGSGAYAPPVQGGPVAPRYGVPGSGMPGAGTVGPLPSGGRVPGSMPPGAFAPGGTMPGAAMPGRPGGVPGTGGRSAGTYGASPGLSPGQVQGLSGGPSLVPVSPFAPAPIDTGISPRRQPGTVPDGALPADPFRR